MARLNPLHHHDIRKSVFLELKGVFFSSYNYDDDNNNNNNNNKKNTIFYYYYYYYYYC